MRGLGGRFNPYEAMKVASDGLILAERVEAGLSAYVCGRVEALRDDLQQHLGGEFHWYGSLGDGILEALQEARRA